VHKQREALRIDPVEADAVSKCRGPGGEYLPERRTTPLLLKCRKYGSQSVRAFRTK
jgi:hypothetical protein